ncbi:MAG: class I SAM-dependent methyltransferase family protein [Candidatus Bathyarchaeia archaeon]
MPTESFCIKVPKTQVEKTLTSVKKLDLHNPDLEIKKSADAVLIPIKRQLFETELLTLKTQAPELQLSTAMFTERKKQKTHIDFLADKVPQELLAKLPRALDVIGDIAIVEFPPELNLYSSLIGDAIIKTHKHIRTVLAKAGAVSGIYRLRELIPIAGEPKTFTIHKEYGCQYHVDLSKAYFSPRLSNEHHRVASLVQNNEIVVDLFAGVGPFAVLIAKEVPTVKVYAVDINPDAVDLLQKNVRLNRVENRVFPILGDADDVVKKRLSGVADRVIMNLPEKAIDYIEAACITAKPIGAILHFYCFIRQPDTIAKLQTRLSEAISKAGRRVDQFLFAKTVRETAPYEWQAVVDAKIL